MIKTHASLLLLSLIAAPLGAQPAATIIKSISFLNTDAPTDNQLRQEEARGFDFFALLGFIGKTADTLSKLHLDELFERFEKDESEHFHAVSPEHRRRVAHHEAGHTLVQALLGLPYESVDIKNRRHGMCALFKKDAPAHFCNYTREKLISVIKTMQGGFAAEKVMYGSFANDTSGDLVKAAELAIAMIKRWGMSLEHEGVPCIPVRGELGHSYDAEVHELLKACWQETVDLLEKHKASLMALGDKLDAFGKLTQAAIAEAVYSVQLSEDTSEEN